jgi:hypothetical protein
LTFENCGHIPQAFVTSFGIPAAEWEKMHSVYALRSCVLTPYLTNNKTYDEYWGNFMTTMQKILVHQR